MKLAHRVLSATLLATAILVIWRQHELANERARSASTEARGIRAAQKAGTGCMEVCPTDGTVLYADAEAAAVFGYQPGELNKKKLASLMPAWLAAYHDQHMMDALARAKADPAAPRIVIVQCDALDKTGNLVRVITRTFLDPDQGTLFAYVNKSSAAIWKNIEPVDPNKPIMP